jgi:hypothetical protein
MARTRNRTKTDASTKDDAAESGAEMSTEQRKALAENRRLSMSKEVHANSEQENAKIVAAAVSKPNGDEEPEAKDEPKPEKAKTNPEHRIGAVAGAWIKAHVDGKRTREQLLTLAEKQNPSVHQHPTKADRKVPYSAKQIVEMDKIGKLMPGNFGGYYWPEGTAPDKGGIEILIDPETKIVTLKK